MQDSETPRPVGSLYGYKVLLKGEFDYPFARHKWKVPSGILETDDPQAVLDARTRFSLDSIVTFVAKLGVLRLNDPAGFAEEIRKVERDPSITFLPFLMRRLVTHVIVERELPDTHTEDVIPYWLLMAEQVLMDMASVADRASRDDEDDKWSTQSLAMRALQAQSHDQLDYSYYKRELWINRQTVKAALNLGLDLELSYQEAYGLSYSQLAALSFAAYSTAASIPGAIFNPREWNRNGIIALPRDRIEAYFRLCSVSYEEFKAHATDPRVAPQGYESYSLSPLIRYPLIIRSDGLAVAPMLQDLLERPNRAFRIDVLQALESSDVGRFNQALGETYEDYKWRSLDSASGCGNVRRGEELLPPGAKNCDFICLEDRTATLIEVKAVWVGVLTDITKDRARLRREFNKEGGVVDGLIQLNDSARAIRTGETPVPKNAILNAALIFRGEQVLLNSPLVRELLEELVHTKSGRRMMVKFHLMNDIGVSAVVRLLADSGSLGRFLYDKRRHETEQYDDFHHTAWSHNPELPPHPLEELGNEALDDLTSEHLAPPESQ